MIRGASFLFAARIIAASRGRRVYQAKCHPARVLRETFLSREVSLSQRGDNFIYSRLHRRDVYAPHELEDLCVRVVKVTSVTR